MSGKINHYANVVFYLMIKIEMDAFEEPIKWNDGMLTSSKGITIQTLKRFVRIQEIDHPGFTTFCRYSNGRNDLKIKTFTVNHVEYHSDRYNDRSDVKYKIHYAFDEKIGVGAILYYRYEILNKDIKYEQ